MTEQKENKPHHQIPDWLKKIQENSWELELLISGGAIFSLFQLSDSWVHWIESLVEFSSFMGYTEILLIGTLGIELLKIGFIIHIILRAIPKFPEVEHINLFFVLESFISFSTEEADKIVILLLSSII